MAFELVPCKPGDRWFPWNYRRNRRSGDRVPVARFDPEPGLAVVNAVDTRGRVLGSCALRLGYRHSEFVLSDEEYQYGAAAAGPAYFWPDDERSPWIMVVKSFWVRPAERRRGIARAFAEYARGFGLPAYLGFANRHMKALFDREYRPTRKTSPLQKKIARALRASSDEFEPEREPDFTIYLQAEASALHLWRSWHGGQSESVELDRVLCWPDRAGFWEIDSGESYEIAYSDSAFAEDRSYGYALSPWLDSWGVERGPFDLLPDGADDADYEAAEVAFGAESAYAAGSIEGWVTDAEAMRSYATVRYFLRRCEWREFATAHDAARELFVSDLSEEPRGLRRFSALVSPLTRDHEASG